MARASSSTPVAGRGSRAVTGGCLTVLTVLILALGSVLAWMAYASHRADTGNTDRREEAQAVVEQKARRAASVTVRALTTAQGDVSREAAEDIVLRHAKDPDLGRGTVAAKVTYAKTPERLTAVALFADGYEVRPAVWGPVRIESATRCYALAFQRDSGTWHAKVTPQPEAACTRRQPITAAAQAAQEALRAITRTSVNRAQVQTLLEPLDGATYEVTTVTGRNHTVTVTALVHTTGDQQCYRFVRRTDSAGEDAVTTTPIAAAHCAD
ncbi:hypothetical protein ACFVT5_20950 [Streptomyces sp. NPDC058001]|uniref:hypothetical protein n=1 Tax=Streptomyces sp. NPDC058001 TaxID=3346300 RepID=UPI0036ED8A8E